MINNIDSLIEKSKALLINQSNQLDKKEESSSIIFTGNIHDSFPRRLITDPYLTARDKLAWQLIRLHSQQNNQGAVFPSYDELQTMLANLPCNGAKASRSTVSYTLLKLRLTRWISLCQTVRNQHTGTVIGNIYFLHDEPLSVIDAIRFDLTYLDLLQESICHSNNQVKYVAEQMITQIVKNKNFNHLISYMPLYEERLKNLANLQITLDKNLLSSKSELSENQLSSKTRLSKNSLSSKSGLSLKSMSYIDSSSTTSTSIYKNTSTSISLEQISWPQEFADLEDKHKIISIANKLSIDINLFNAVIFEVSERTKRQKINSITAYTISTLKKAANGLFNQYGGEEYFHAENEHENSVTEPNDVVFTETDTVVTPEMVTEKLNEIRNTLTQIKIN